MDRFEIRTGNADETRKLGKEIGRLAEAGDIYLLIGDLGAGKTCLTQGIAWGMEIEEYTRSPSFVIMRELRGRLALYHMDFYRLDNIAEISDLGLDDYLYGKGVCVIEWADKGLAVLPDNHLRVRIKYLSENDRSLEFEASGERYERLLKELSVKYCS